MIVLGEDWERVSKKLDEVIKSNTYEEGVKFIRSMDITLDKQERLERCLLSYKRSC
jgi:hypothetical protein